MARGMRMLTTWLGRATGVVLALGAVVCQAADLPVAKPTGTDLSPAEIEKALQRIKEVTKALDAIELPVMKPTGRALSPAEIRKFTRQGDELLRLADELRGIHDLVPQPPWPDDGVERAFLPAREIASPLKSEVYLWQMQRQVAAFVPGMRAGLAVCIDDKLGVTEPSPLPGFSSLAVGVGAERGWFFITNKFAGPQSLDAVLRIAGDGARKEVIRFDAASMLGEKYVAVDGPVPTVFAFFEWGDGYGLLCRDFENVTGPDHIPDHSLGRAWIVRFDARFKRTGAFALGRGGGFGAFAVGPEKTIATITRPGSIAFLYPDGECHVVPVAPAKPWAKKMFAGPGSGGVFMRTRPGIEDGSELFAVPYRDRGTLPVIDISTKPPKLLHTLDVGGMSLDCVVSLVVGRRVYVKRETRNAIYAYDFSGDRVNVLWTGIFPGSGNKGQGYLGYYKGNIIAPGLAKITFIDENTGLINYEFLTPDAPGQPPRPDDGKPRLSRAEPYIRSYAITGDYLIGSSRNRGKPIYAWKIPEKLIPRKPLAK